MYLAVIMRAPRQSAPAEAWSPPHTCSSLTDSPASTVIRSLLAVRSKLERYPLSCTKQVLRRIAPWSQCRSAQSARGVIHFSIWSPAWDELTDVDWFPSRVTVSVVYARQSGRYTWEPGRNARYNQRSLYPSGIWQLLWRVYISSLSVKTN